MITNYINNNSALGLKYDWVQIKKEWKKLEKYFKKIGVSDVVLNPLNFEIWKYRYNIFLSERSRGKTTNFLLLGLLFNKLYGTVIQYIRQTEDDIKASNLQLLFDVIISNNYVEFLTDGEYNTIIYNARRFYYAFVENNEIKRKSSKSICNVLSIQKQQDIKSTYNCPLGDFIIFDEFISNAYYKNEFSEYMQLLKTIIRERQSPIIFMLANSLNVDSDYFHEMEIYETAKMMLQGDTKTIITELGTTILIHILDKNKSQTRQIQNKEFFGFTGFGMSSITGSTPWLIKEHQKINNDWKLSKILYTVHFYVSCYYTKDIAVDIYYCHELNKIIGVARWATKEYRYNYIYVNDDTFIYDKRYHYLFSNNTKIDKVVKNLIDTNLIYYKTNDCKTALNRFFAK